MANVVKSSESDSKIERETERPVPENSGQQNVESLSCDDDDVLKNRSWTLHDFPHGHPRINVFIDGSPLPHLPYSDQFHNNLCTLSDQNEIISFLESKLADRRNEIYQHDSTLNFSAERPSVPTPLWLPRLSDAPQRPDEVSHLSNIVLTLTPLDDAEVDSPHSSPSFGLPTEENRSLERLQTITEKWQSQMKGYPPLEATSEEYGNSLVVWAPPCVPNLSAFSAMEKQIQLDFSRIIPEQLRVLTLLSCLSGDLALNGDLLPCLLSLDVSYVELKLSGDFLQLRMLSLFRCRLVKPWELNAPLLQSFTCHESTVNKNLIIRPHLLPKLSFLKIVSSIQGPSGCPEIIDGDNGRGISFVDHVELVGDIASPRYFHQLQVSDVRHLKLVVDEPLSSALWRDAVWQCETLEIFPCRSSPENVYGVTVMLPQLPRVKTLTATDEYTRLQLNAAMPSLTECTVSSPNMFGPSFLCPALRCIRFSDRELSHRSRMRCLDKATYIAIGAQPSKVYLPNGDAFLMTWSTTPKNSIEKTPKKKYVEIISKGGMDDVD